MHKIFTNSEISKPLKNGVWLYLLQFFNTVLPLITLPYITRVMGAESYGVFSKSLNIIVYFQVVVEYGFGMSATRRVALNKTDKNRIERIFNEVLYSRLFLLILCNIVIIAICIVSKDIKGMTCILILSSCLIGYCIQQNWLFQGMQEMKYVSVINIIARTISTLLIFLLINNKTQLYLYCFLYSVSPFISGFLGCYIANRRYKLSLLRPSLGQVINGLKDGWHVFTTQFSGKILNIVGITCLGIFNTDYEVGIYSAINKISQVFVLLWMPISQVLYPISSKKLSESFKSGTEFIFRMRRFFMLLFGTGVIFASMLSKQLVNIAFGKEYGAYYYLLIPQMVFVIVAINNNFLGCQMLLGGGYDSIYSKCFQITVIATIAINFIFIYLWGTVGASFSPLVSESFLSILLYNSFRKIERVNEIS